MSRVIKETFPLRSRPDPGELEQLLAPNDVAKLLQTSVKHIYGLTRRRRDPLPCIKLGKYARFRESEVRAWQDRNHN